MSLDPRAKLTGDATTWNRWQLWLPRIVLFSLILVLVFLLAILAYSNPYIGLGLAGTLVLFLPIPRRIIIKALLILDEKTTTGLKREAPIHVATPQENVPQEEISPTTARKLKGTLERLQSVTGVVQSIITILAVLVAGTWFVVQREGVPKVIVAHTITHRQINRDEIWLHVTITVANPGKRRIRVEFGTVRVLQILPLHKDILAMKAQGKHLIPVYQSQVVWPLIDQREIKEKVGIEPGEKDEFHHDFIIPSSLQTIQIYSFFPKQIKPLIGWSKKTTYDIAPSLKFDKQRTGNESYKGQHRF